MSIYEYVIDQLQRRKGSWQTVCDDTGLDYSWLSKCARGSIKDPSVHRIQRLAEYFQAEEKAAA
jgi:hypothetical protein